jgi:hypothetical protein
MLNAAISSAKLADLIDVVLCVIWVNRLGKQKETLPFKPDIEAKSVIEVSKVFESI